ncbi:MAG TPA: protein translocase subunit SecF [Pyrinomonadaceae bacterium]|jgi:preprotein translocase subunit SecF|nr:protein translocase subunit SecF [Pyrinomonadaceae bacterium]
MIRIFENIRVDWLGKRRALLGLSVLIMLAGLGSAIGRELVPGGTGAFNLGVDFRGGTLVTVNFKQRPDADAIRDALGKTGLGDSVIQPALDKDNQVLIKLAQQGGGEEATQAGQVDIGQSKVRDALASFGQGGKLAEGADWEIAATDAVGPVAGKQLRNQAVTVTLLALVGILLYIAFRFEWTYGASAVITVFHDVLVTLGFFSIFQWEVNLTVVAALLTLVGFSVNDTIVTFDRVRENLRLHRGANLYDTTNEAINQTLSRTVITSGLVFLSVVAMVFFGGEVLRPFSLALLIGIVFGTYSTIAISNPIMVWWQQRLEASRRAGGSAGARTGSEPRRAAPEARGAKAAAR